MPRAPRVSPTTEGLSSSVFEALRARARARPRRVHALHVGDTWREPPACARAETLATAGHPMIHAYAPPHGEPVLLDAIERRLARHGGAVERERIQVVSGATSGLSAACQTLLDAGDEVIIPTPCWPLIPGIIRSRGAVVVEAPVMTRLREPGFDLAAAIDACVTPRTAALYVNTPHNPTGWILTSDELAAFASVARRHDLWILGDEVYEDLWFAHPPPAPLWQRDDARDATLSNHSASKAFGMTGARVGWTHGPLDAMRALRAVYTHQVYCAPRPMQALAARALEHGGEWLEETRGLYERAARRCSDALSLPMPEAGTFLFFDARPWLPQGSDVLPFLERCLDAGVLLTPGAACGSAFATWARLCFTSVPPDDLDDAIERLSRIMLAG